MTSTGIFNHEKYQLKKNLLKLANSLTLFTCAQVAAKQFTGKQLPSFPVNKNLSPLSKVKKLKK